MISAQCRNKLGQSKNSQDSAKLDQSDKVKRTEGFVYQNIKEDKAWE